ncbi:MAG: D-glycero-beta-D-manno-heptose-7-phosphate kinase [Bacteroidetes bacterium]|nr:D-glycero-beta-D-manno-heptose-7-phosphate kinase [Bacteroidota bacterium]
MDLAQVNALFQEFNSKKVLIIGDVMVDAYLWGKVDRISPEAPVPVVAVKKKDYRMGGAANVAKNVANLGAEPMLCSVIGNGPNGQLFTQLLRESGISDKWMVRSNNRPTTIKTRVIAGHQQMLRIDEEVTDALDFHEQAAMEETVTKALVECDIVVFEDYDKGVLSPGLITSCMAMAEKLGKTVLVDPKKKNFLFYQGATVFKPNLKELQEGLKLDLPSEFSIDSVARAAAKLRQVLGAQTAMITLSEHGVYIGSETEEYHIPAHKRDIYDVSGAGDTVIAISAVLLACGAPIKLVAELANLGGGLVCERVGVVPIEKEQLRQEAIKLLTHQP